MHPHLGDNRNRQQNTGVHCKIAGQLTRAINAGQNISANTDCQSNQQKNNFKTATRLRGSNGHKSHQ